MISAWHPPYWARKLGASTYRCKGAFIWFRWPTGFCLLGFCIDWGR